MELSSEQYLALFEQAPDFMQALDVKGYISEDGWAAFDRENPSVAAYDLENCEEPDALIPFGIGSLTVHENALALAKAILAYGY